MFTTSKSLGSGTRLQTRDQLVVPDRMDSTRSLDFAWVRPQLITSVRRSGVGFWAPSGTVVARIRICFLERPEEVLSGLLGLPDDVEGSASRAIAVMRLLSSSGKVCATRTTVSTGRGALALPLPLEDDEVTAE